MRDGAIIGGRFVLKTNVPQGIESSSLSLPANFI